MVFKRKDLELLGPRLLGELERLIYIVGLIWESKGIPKREYLVIESDWPEYEIALNLIQKRMEGEHKL